MTDQSKTKPSIEQIDTISVNEQPLKPQYEELDKFGAALVKSPAEIALVKKLDLYMMNIVWFMYFVNLLDSKGIVNGKIEKMDKDIGIKGVQYNN